jgi:hypothetical protein
LTEENDMANRWGEVEAEHISVRTGMTDDSPALIVEREFQGRLVLLHGCLEPPEDVEPTEVIDLTGPGGASVREKQ